MFILGQTLKDKVSGFKGIATSRTTFLNGCVRIAIQAPMDAKGIIPEEKWSDEGQLTLVNKGVSKDIKQMKTGGPTSNVAPKWNEKKLK